MARKGPPAFSFYASDWLTSQRVLAMRPEQEGAYVRLLAYAWEDEDCSIPSADTVLAVMSRLGQRWARLREGILVCFVPHPNRPDRLINKKQFALRMEQEDYAERQRKAGEKGAGIRWGRHSDPNGAANRGATEVPMGSDSSPSPTPIPTPKKNTGAEPPATRQTWLTPFGDAWRDRYGGDMPVKPSLGPLGTVRADLGPDEALDRWRRYLAATEGSYASAARFAATIGDWTEAGPATRQTSTGRAIQQLLSEGKP